MEPNQIHKKNKLATLINWTEKLVIVTLVIGIIMNYLDMFDSKMILLISLAGLSIVFFASAFIPKEIFSSQEEADEHGQFGMMDLLGLMIIPKVLWISSAVSAFGVFAYLADFGNDGYLKALTVGGLAIAIALIVLIIALISGTKNLNKVNPVLLRAIPLLILDAYILLA